MKPTARIKEHCDYIHYYPVKNGLVNSPSEWKNNRSKVFIAKSGGQSAMSELTEMDFE